MFEDIFKFIRLNLPKGNYYIVGGATRDFLLNRNKEIKDIDIATNLTPAEIKEFLPDANYRFENVGTVNYKYLNYHLTFATFRKEADYVDHRHPKKIEFIDSYIEDSKRRDFTINAIYFSSDGTILDPQDGLEDIKTRTLRMIGDPSNRLKEDPLRIIRCLRFAFDLDLNIDKSLDKAIIDNSPLLAYLSPNKIKEELNKCKNKTKDKIIDILQLSIDN